MRHQLAKCAAVTAVAVAALAGCGGGGGDASSSGQAQPQPTGPAPFMGATVQSLLDYMNQLIAQTDETSEPQPLADRPLPVDDSV
jgi:ABC-type glycerol-3-phosphate transport system substrate-binding protein